MNWQLTHKQLPAIMLLIPGSGLTLQARTEATSGTDRVTAIQYSVNLSKTPDAGQESRSVYRLNKTAQRKHRAAASVIEGKLYIRHKQGGKSG